MKFPAVRAGHPGEAHHAPAPVRPVQPDPAGQLPGGDCQMEGGAKEKFSHPGESGGQGGRAAGADFSR